MDLFQKKVKKSFSFIWMDLAGKMRRMFLRQLIIGGGAAGIFAAIRCKELMPFSEVIVLERTNQLLSKVRISGGGRCNVTHSCFEVANLVKNYPRGSKELLGPFHHFQPKDIISWFEERGVCLKTESDGRMFPITDSSETIIQCLLKAANDRGVEIRKQQRIQAVQKIDNVFCIQLENAELTAQHLLLATGSSTTGHAIAAALGHEIIEPLPSLFTFNTPTSPLLDLAGIVVMNATLRLKETGHEQQGALLLTHWGFSGPAALKLSAWAARELHFLDYKATLIINWTSFQNQEALYQTLLKEKQKNPLGSLPQFVAKKLQARLLETLAIDAKTALGQFSHKQLMQIANKLTADPYLIHGKTTNKEEFVTAGGVHLKEIDFKTMQSRITPGLFFAGEILNIDGITGGFNFQHAWTSAYLAATAMATHG